MSATISLLGLYNYDNTILDGLTLPPNFAEGDINTLKSNLLMETAELEILYSDPTYLKYAITQWCSKNRPTWKWLKDTQQYDYVPIWNADYKISDRTDRTEGNVGTSHNLNEFTRGLYTDTTAQKDYTRNLSDVMTHGEVIDDTKTFNHSEIERHTNNDNDKNFTMRTQTTDHDIVNTGTETTTHNVFAFNESSTAHPESNNVRDIDGTNPLRSRESGIVDNFDNLEVNTSKTGTDTAKETHSGTDKHDLGGADSTHDAEHVAETGGTTTEDTGRTTSDTDENVKYDRWLRGNYGQTTTQDMIRQEQELAKFNLFDYIITDFKKRFCIMVY